jgi:S1-C subfamily serine protease
MRATPFVEVPGNNRVLGTVVPLLGLGADGSVVQSGSGFFVAPGLLVTARHVVDDYWRQLTGERMTADAVAQLKDNAGFSIIASQLVDGHPVQWDIIRMFAADPVDVVFLEAQRHDGAQLPNSWPVATFSFLPPSVGELIFAIGFPFQKYETVGAQQFRWNQKASLAGGEVDEVHPHHRDSARLPFPCFRTNARFEGGMSGGPVVNALGQVCGVICQSLPANAPTEDHASYVSLLWPCLSFPFDNLAWVTPHPSTVTFRDLFENHVLDSPDWTAVTLSDDGRTATIRLAPTSR